MDIQQQEYLKHVLQQYLDLNTDKGIKCHKMSGGAIQENWSITPIDKEQHWNLVLRKNADTVLENSSDRQQEYQLLKRLYERGIKVPKVLYFSNQNDILHSDFFLMQKITGITEGHKLVRLDHTTQQRQCLQEIGIQLANIHQIITDDQIEAFLPKPTQSDYLNQVFHQFLVQIDQLNRHQPILEFAIKWMKDHQPQVDDLVLVHGDFRTGNLMIDGDQLTGILDWEFAHWGDRREDIGWFTAKCWRFGQDHNLAGGIGAYKDFMRAYSEVSDIYIAEFELKFWHILAHVRWAIIAMQQAHRNQDNAQPSLELALTDFLVPLLEKNILDLLGDKE